MICYSIVYRNINDLTYMSDQGHIHFGIKTLIIETMGPACGILGALKLLCFLATKLSVFISQSQCKLFPSTLSSTTF